jgi:hypothetical protein
MCHASVPTKHHLPHKPRLFFAGSGISDLVTGSVLEMQRPPHFLSVRSKYSFHIIYKKKRFKIYQTMFLIHRINGFSDFAHRPDSTELEDVNTTFRKLDLFPSSGEGKTYSVGSLRKS